MDASRQNRRLWRIAIVACALSARADDGRFGDGVDARKRSAEIAANPIYNSRPLSLGCWVRIASSNGFNIIVANEPKSSQTHWELYTYAGPGVLSVYMPSYEPAEIKSSTRITDGKWHYVGMVLEENRARLYADGKLAADQVLSRPATLATKAGPLAFGRLSEGRIGCDGVIDDIQLSDVIRPFDAVPVAEAAADEHTIGLWHLDGKPDATSLPDTSRLAAHARVTPPVRPHRAPTPQKAIVPQVLAFSRDRLEQIATEVGLTSPGLTHVRNGVIRDWGERYGELVQQINSDGRTNGGPEQIFDAQALADRRDVDPLGVVLRRTEAVLSDLQAMAGTRDLRVPQSDWDHLDELHRSLTLPGDKERRDALYFAACALRRQIVFSNPLLDFDRILFVARACYSGSRLTNMRNSDAIGGHFANQYFGFNAVPGGGLYTIENWRAEPRIGDVLKDVQVASGRLAGTLLDHGAFLSPDLSYDGSSLVFAHTSNDKHNHNRWTPQTTWNLFRLDLRDGERLSQLTDSEFNDFDPCWLPNGRIAFVSERRGGYIRCFTEGAGNIVPTYVLHSMAGDGTDVIPLSYFETSEWHPSVNHDGMIVYTRWDYTDREDCLGSFIWTCYPDGRDPRAPYGNYPVPWHTFGDNPRRGERCSLTQRPLTQMSIRHVPDSRLYMFTAAPHHGEAYGTLCMLDLRTADDNHMSGVKRVTPYHPFPESEQPGRSQYRYGTAWPLSDSYYLCNSWEDLYVLDRFGNLELICERALLPCASDDRLRLIDPIPLRPRARPPILPTQTAQGEAARPDAPVATIAIMNVYDTDLPLPQGARVKYLRVTQNILKTNPWMDLPRIGYAQENTPRIPLGIVPVEADGSVYFEAPVERELIFQLLDDEHRAIHSMRAVAYVHPGESLRCIGCHEPGHATSRKVTGTPMALQRPPTHLQPEAGAVEPITFYRLVKPIFDAKCVACHREKKQGPQDMTYKALEPYVFYFSGGFHGRRVMPDHGGSRTIPGRFGARNSRMGRALFNKTHLAVVSPEERLRIVLWLDSNSPRLGAHHSEAEQIAGQVVWPLLDVDPRNPQGLERLARQLPPAPPPPPRPHLAR